jgi:hypothetical protein
MPSSLLITAACLLPACNRKNKQMQLASEQLTLEELSDYDFIFATVDGEPLTLGFPQAKSCCHTVHDEHC